MEPFSANGRLLPGFRFSPMNVELIMYYLKRKVLGKRLKPEMVTEVDVYQFHPKDLQEFSSLKKDLNWYFFCPRGKKYGCGDRTNRATHSGYWKATGVDRDVSYEDRTVGKIKTLIFHEGKPPKGVRTNWVMHEYRLQDQKLADEGVCQGLFVLCKIFEKSGWGPKNGEQYGAPFIEEEWDDEDDQLVDFGNHNQSTSVGAHANAFSSEQAYSGAVSEILDMDQELIPMPDVAAGLDSSSKAVIPYSDYAAGQVLAPISAVSNLASSSNASFHYCNNDPRVIQVATSPMMLTCAADIASTYTHPVPNEDYDEADRWLDMLVADDNCSDVFGSLHDMDYGTASGGGLHLADLDPPLDGLLFNIPD